MVNSEEAPKTQRETLLNVARSLDRFGRRFERFATLQLEQLQIAIDQFERDKAEFERQRDREILQIENHRKSLAGRVSAPAAETGAVVSVPVDPDVSRLREIRRKAVAGRATSANPLRVIVGLGSASEMEVARLALEFSNVCRAFGGQGIRFEINDCRVDEAGLGLVELHAFSNVPLAGENTGPEVLANWETFKSATVLMSVLEPMVEKTFKTAEAVDRAHPSRKLTSIAIRRADDVEQRGMLSSDKSAAKQLQRLEHLIESLASEFDVTVAASLI